MQWSLFLLLMGQCSFFTCRLYEYHVIEESKTWKDAQTHCREHHTDLATVYDVTDMTRLRDSTKNQDEAWIGLYSNPGGDNRRWHWSLPGVEFNDRETEWGAGEPYNGQPLENCVWLDNKKLTDDECTNERKFICYDETKKLNKSFHLIDNQMTWPEAQNYCRENHTDLVSGRKQLKDDELRNEKVFWIGLFRDTWRWSDGSNFSFRNWEVFEDEEDDDNNKCAMTVLNGKWGSDDCNEIKPFVCYDDDVILIEKNKTWEEALTYCRKNHRDLVSITNLDQQRWVQEKAKEADTTHVWLGLRYTCTLGFWFWVSDEVVRHENWASDGEKDGCGMSAAMDTGGQHKWFKKAETEQFNFICSKR
ncbi:C-type mannose receptor 2-like [Enoplosus armatus]|uniref:C-type mannose receptor 2-like n=1 Tax=Enoplosus armatus TaxID=215367 RepID=UPI003996594F